MQTCRRNMMSRSRYRFNCRQETVTEGGVVEGKGGEEGGGGWMGREGKGR